MAWDFVGRSGIALANNPHVTALRQKVKALREEEKTVVKVIQAQYDSVINKAKLDEPQLGQLRKELLAQERQYLLLTTDKEQKANIRRNYEHLRRVLGGEGRLDAGAIRQLREQETAHVRLVQTVYKAKILELEQGIQVASKVNPTVKGRRR